jgi:hypothetical protein
MANDGSSKIGLPAGRQGVPSKIGPSSTNNNQATAPELSEGFDSNSNDVYTYITQLPSSAVPATQLLYSADRRWSSVTVVLETAGPVAVGFKQTIDPATSGKGVLLVTNVPRTFTIAKGNKFWITSPSVNRINIQIESIPWLEQITAVLKDILKGVRARLASGSVDGNGGS